MALTPTEFKAALPEFASVSDATVQLYLDMAYRNLALSVWGGRIDDGALWLTAHLLTCFSDGSNAGAATGPVAMKKVGEVSASFAVGDAFKNSAYGSTKYGQQYLEFLELVCPGFERCL